MPVEHWRIGAWIAWAVLLQAGLAGDLSAQADGPFAFIILGALFILFASMRGPTPT